MTISHAMEAFTLRHPVRERKLVAVSGGRDSVALLHALADAGHRRLVVCHLDHRLRGRQSREDAAFVKRLAARLGLPVELGTEDVAAAARASGVSEETEGRAARHRFFAACAARHRCPRVVLAHHAGDQAETVLFQLFRGSAGLRGMRGESVLTVPGRRRGLQLLRPLLGVPRQEIDTWVETRGLKFREDASNAVPDPVRNRLRLEVIPAICRAMGRDIRETVCRAAELAAAEQEWMDQLVLPHTLEAELDVKWLRCQPLGMQRRVIHGWLKARGFCGVGSAAVEAVRALLDPVAGPVAVNLPGNRFVRRRHAKLRALP